MKNGKVKRAEVVIETTQLCNMAVTRITVDIPLFPDGCESTQVEQAVGSGVTGWMHPVPGSRTAFSEALTAMDTQFTRRAVVAWREHNGPMRTGEKAFNLKAHRAFQMGMAESGGYHALATKKCGVPLE